MGSRFVQLTRSEWSGGKKYVWINPANVAALEQWTSDNATAIHLTSGSKIVVQESPQAVREALVLGQVVQPIESVVEETLIENQGYEPAEAHAVAEEVIARMPAT